MENNDKTAVQYFVHEAEMARMERANARLWILCIVLLISLLGTNIGWTCYEHQFETIEEEVTEVRADGKSNAIVNESGTVNFSVNSNQD